MRFDEKCCQWPLSFIHKKCKSESSYSLSILIFHSILVSDLFISRFYFKQICQYFFISENWGLFCLHHSYGILDGTLSQNGYDGDDFTIAVCTEKVRILFLFFLTIKALNFECRINKNALLQTYLIYG